MTVIIIFAMGLVTGVLSGLFGVGGGIVLIPMMVLTLGIPQHLAQGISMLMMIPTALVGIWHFHKDNLVNYRMAAYMASGAIVGALISANFVQLIPADILRRVFGIFIVIVGSRMLLTKSANSVKAR
ncbi:MAG: sulfite exporter TauE/SafE family protein [Negativicutes bacterium]|nr:sulfite exporter TauE/SafE family protein [Negativicutes bacterium]